MDQGFNFSFVNDAYRDDRGVLEHYPYKWAYVPPNDPDEGLTYLNDLGKNDEGAVDADAIFNQYEKMPTFELLKEQGLVEWSDEIRQDTPPSGFKMIPEWGPMSGVLLNWADTLSAYLGNASGNYQGVSSCDRLSKSWRRLFRCCRDGMA
jgi:hypothetical protein